MEGEVEEGEATMTEVETYAGWKTEAVRLRVRDGSGPQQATEAERDGGGAGARRQMEREEGVEGCAWEWQSGGVENGEVTVTVRRGNGGEGERTRRGKKRESRG